MRTYQVRLSGVDVSVTVLDSGLASGSDDVLGDAYYTFDAATSALLAPKRLITYNGLGNAFEQTLAETVEDSSGSPWNPEECSGELTLGVDAGIGAVSLLLSRGEPFAFSIDMAEGSDFWALHDLIHADMDVSSDWEEGYADFAPVGAWAEDRANLEGARLALRAGVSLDSVLSSLLAAGKALAERFKGEESTALGDLLSGGLDFLPDDVRARYDLERVEREVAECAALILDDTGHDSLDLDGLSEVTTEVAEGLAHYIPSGVLLAMLADFDELGDAYAGSGETPDIDARASYAFGRAVCERVDSLARCPECSDARIVRGSDKCSDCAEFEDSDSDLESFDAFLSSEVRE